MNNERTDHSRALAERRRSNRSCITMILGGDIIGVATAASIAVLYVGSLSHHERGEFRLRSIFHKFVARRASASGNV